MNFCIVKKYRRKFAWHGKWGKKAKAGKTVMCQEIPFIKHMKKKINICCGLCLSINDRGRFAWLRKQGRNIN